MKNDTVEYYLGIKHEILYFVTAWVNVKDIMVRV